MWFGVNFTKFLKIKLMLKRAKFPKCYRLLNFYVNSSSKVFEAMGLRIDDREIIRFKVRVIISTWWFQMKQN